MARFLFAVDIANRGLDHIGQDPISESLGFTQPGKTAALCARVYDKLRRAELQENAWRFALKKAVLRPIISTTLKLVAALWSASTTYFVGSIVSDQYGTIWISNTPDNLNNDPLNSSAWDQYFGPMTVSLWDTTTTTTSAGYNTGELVYTTPGDGTNRVYLSLVDGNTDNPATATAWDATVTYFKDQVVTRSAVAYMSRIDNNLNQDPLTTFFADWSSSTTYVIGNKVTGSDGVIYTSTTNGNLNHDPTTDGGLHWSSGGVLSPWDSTFVGGTGSIKWRQIGGTEFPSGVTVTTLNIVWPVAFGPLSNTFNRNVFRLPANFLRKAPADSKAGSYSFLGSPGNLAIDDWEFWDQYFTSWCSTPIIFTFVADFVDVARMDDMFCEGLGARIGLEVCEPLTQSTAKKQACASEYVRAIGIAKRQNGILIGAIMPPLDDYIACRV
jgi:hypothetical protein